MTRTFKRIIAAAIIFIVIAAGAVALVVSGGCSSKAASAGNPLDGIKNGAMNAVIDISGIKGYADSELREHAGALASELGVPQSYANQIVDSLAIQDWRATSLPADAKETSTSTLKVRDIPTTIKTYEDPSVVTVGAYGFEVTLEVPESAQTYTPFLQYIQYLT